MRILRRLVLALYVLALIWALVVMVAQTLSPEPQMTWFWVSFGVFVFAGIELVDVWLARRLRNLERELKHQRERRQMATRHWQEWQWPR